MDIKDYDLYHGAVFTKIARTTPKPVSISSYKQSNNSYIIAGDKQVGIHVKHSTERWSPWHFTLTQDHQNEIHKMKEDIGEVILALVCHTDGIAGLRYDEVKNILDKSQEQKKWISVRRRKREMYTVKGNDGELPYKVSRDLSQKIFKTIFNE